MTSRNGCYAKTPDVVLRPFEEWGHAYAFTPSEPDIIDLNSTAYFIVELCDGRPYGQIENEFVATVGERIGVEKARSQFHNGFSQLLERNIISASD
jgi:Coenzyme PQQ synthesis protein D (PqqD)